MSSQATRGEFELHIQSVRATNNTTVSIPVQLASSTLPERKALKVTLPPPYPTTGLDGAFPLYYSDAKSEKAALGREDEDEEERVYPTFTPSTPIEKGGKRAPGVSYRKTRDDQEPKTLARLLFLYGFMMPLFWMFGTSIIFLDLKYIPDARLDAEDPRSEEERQADLAVIRRAELKWAWRSLYALVVTVMIALTAVLIWLGVTGRWNGAA